MAKSLIAKGILLARGTGHVGRMGLGVKAQDCRKAGLSMGSMGSVTPLPPHSWAGKQPLPRSGEVLVDLLRDIHSPPVSLGTEMWRDGILQVGGIIL